MIDEDNPLLSLSAYVLGFVLVFVILKVVIG